MATNNVSILLTASDQTRAAFTSAQSGLDRMRASAGTLSSSLAKLGVGLSVGTFAAFVKNSIDAADNINDLSQKIGVSVETLAGYKLAAEQAGTSQSDS